MWPPRPSHFRATRGIALAVAAILWQGCSSDKMAPPGTGAIAVTIATTGAELDPDGYSLSLDGLQGAAIDPNTTRILAVDEGDHMLDLAGLAGNCTPIGDGLSRRVTVGAGDTVAVGFEVVCSATAGGLRIVTATTGDALDPNAYTLAVGQDAPRSIGINDTLELAGLAPGDYPVRLLDIAENCGVTGSDSVSVAVIAGETVEVAFAVTCLGEVERWTPMQSGILGDLADVWGSSGADVFAVGEEETDVGGFQLSGVILQYNGSAWSRQPGLQDLSLRGVWGSSGSDVYAVGFNFFTSDGVVLHFDGSQWVELPGFEATDFEEFALLGVWGSSATDVWVVGSAFDGDFARTLIFHFDGSGWQRVGVEGEILPALEDVWGSSATDVYAVGRDEVIDPADGVALHYDGSGWVPVLQEEGLVLNSVWGSSASDVYAGGFTVTRGLATGALRHYDGQSWTPVPIPSVGILHDLWGTSATDVFAAVQDGVVLHYDGTEWTTTTPAQQTLLGIWGSSPSDVFAVGNDGTILHGTP